MIIGDKVHVVTFPACGQVEFFCPADQNDVGDTALDKTGSKNDSGIGTGTQGIDPDTDRSGVDAKAMGYDWRRVHGVGISSACCGCENEAVDFLRFKPGMSWDKALVASCSMSKMVAFLIPNLLVPPPTMHALLVCAIRTSPYEIILFMRLCESNALLQRDRLDVNACFHLKFHLILPFMVVTGKELQPFVYLRF